MCVVGVVYWKIYCCILDFTDDVVVVLPSGISVALVLWRLL